MNPREMFELSIFAGLELYHIIILYYVLTYLIVYNNVGITGDLLEHAVKHKQSLSHVLDISTEESSEGELAAMVSYAIAFPDGFMALVDTYDVKRYFASRQFLSDQFMFCIFVFYWLQFLSDLMI